MNIPTQKILLVLLLIYGAASLVHFIHNAEFLTEYPNLPVSWTRAGIYLAWIEITILGLVGWFIMVLWSPRMGLILLAVYALLGMDSLGHYLLAPISHHTLAMNVTIIIEVMTATLVLIEVARLIAHYTLKENYLG